MQSKISYNKPLKFDSSKQKIWFTSDTHFGHQNILKFCDRPWSTIEEHDEGLISNWNSIVGTDDIVFHLGDFAFAHPKEWRNIISKLNGHIYLIVGNHDETRYPGHDVFEMFEGVSNQMYITIDNKHIYLNHYPFLCYGGTYRNPKDCVWQLFGHVHTKATGRKGKDDERLNICFPFQYDVGVDNNNYKPISWEEVKSKIETQIQTDLSTNL